MTQSHPSTQPPPPQTAPGLRLQLAADLCHAIPEIAQDIATSTQIAESCLDFARRLRLGDTPEEAVTLMAYALAPRHSVWWGHECLKAIPDIVTPQDQEMLQLCAAWVAEPDDSHRYACLEAAAGANPRGPGVWLAMAAGWASGSMAQDGLPAAPAPLFALGRAVNAAILTSLARVPQDKRHRMLDHYLNMAEVLAKSA